jgi:hypothetical protein
VSRDPDRYGVDVGDWEPGDVTGREPDPRDERPSLAELQQDQIEMDEFMRRYRADDRGRDRDA